MNYQVLIVVIRAFMKAEMAIAAKIEIMGMIGALYLACAKIGIYTDT